MIKALHADIPVLLTLLLVTLFFPIYFVVFSSFIMLYDKRFNNTFVFLYTLIVFVFIFYFREYGIYFGGGAGDDVPSYLYAFNFFKDGSTVLDLPSLGIPFSEPFYWFVFYGIGYFTEFDQKIFILFNYIISLSLVLYAYRRLFTNYYLAIFLSNILLNPVFFYATGHVFRQSFSSSIVILAIVFLINGKNKLAIFLGILATLTHVTGIVFLMIMVAYLLSKIKINYLHTRNLIVFTLFFLLILIFSGILDRIFELMNLYTDGKSSLSFAVLMKFLFFSTIMYYLYIQSKILQDETLRVLSFFSLSGTILILLLLLSPFDVASRFEILFRPLISLSVIYYVLTYFKHKNLLFVGLLFFIFLKFYYYSTDASAFVRHLLLNNFDDLYTLSVFDFFEYLNKDI
jgi:hypothetical protein